jgi:hypothetical protein
MEDPRIGFIWVARGAGGRPSADREKTRLERRKVGDEPDAVAAVRFPDEIPQGVAGVQLRGDVADDGEAELADLSKE